MHRLVLVLAMAAHIPAGVLQAQVLSSGFERDVNRYRWTSRAHVAAHARGWDFAIANRFVSDAYVQYDRRLRFRDENILRLSARRPLGSSLAAQVRGHLDWFGLSRAFAQGLYGGLEVRLSPSATVEPFAGIALDRRPGVPLPSGSTPQRLDAGPALGARLAAERSEPGGYQLHVSGDALWQQMSPRKGRAIRLAAGARRRFGGASLEVAAQAASRRRDSYQAVSFLNRAVDRGETVEATVSDTLNASLDVTAPLHGALQLLFQVYLRANRRQIRTHRAPEDALFFDTDFDRRALDFTLGLVYDRPSLAAQVRVVSSAASEERRLVNSAALPPSEVAQKSSLLLQADYDEGILALVGSMRAALLAGLSVRLSGSSRIVRHDTDVTNPDDRDEVYHQGELGVRWQVNRYMAADLQLFGSWFHAVYLKAARSAENNVQRSLRLRPGIRWTPSSRTRLSLTSEVRATYTTADFVIPGRRPTDQSAREMRVEADVDQELWRDAQLRIEGSFADLRLGRLLWDAFAEIPFDTLRTYNAWVRLATGRRLRVELGWRLYLRSDYDRAASVRYDRVGPDGQVLVDAQGRPLTGVIARPARRWIRQMGPTAAFHWDRPPSSLRLEAWANVQRVYHRLYGDLPELSAASIHAAARKGTRRLIPMLTLAVVWNL